MTETFIAYTLVALLATCWFFLGFFLRKPPSNHRLSLNYEGSSIEAEAPTLDGVKDLFTYARIMHGHRPPSRDS